MQLNPVILETSLRAPRNADLLNGIDLGGGYLLLRVRDQLSCVKLRA